MKIEAELLVKCGYAEKSESCGIDWLLFDNTSYVPVICQPYADTLEGRRQLDALEDYLRDKETIHWRLSIDMVPLKSTNHQWRIDRIKWCCEQL